MVTFEKTEAWSPVSAEPAELTVVTSDAEKRTDGSRFIIVESRRLWRDCLLRCFDTLHPDATFVACATINECIKETNAPPEIDAVFLCIGPNEASDDTIRRLVDRVDPIPVVVLSDSEDISHFVTARESGARGCVSASFTVDMVFEAMKMAAAGGFVMSPDGIDALQEMAPKASRVADNNGVALTSRQAAVAEALRHGKPNKIIAHELGMCENTVKVHVRSILTKLNATNRTQAAFKLNEQHGVTTME
ncbi:MAG: response regulator transcription factor [Pseudomonadota bacterium]